MEKKKEKEIRKQIEANRILEQEKLNAKPFRIFTSSENWVTITEWTWKKIRVIGDYIFTGYNVYWQAVFDQVAQYLPKD